MNIFMIKQWAQLKREIIEYRWSMIYLPAILTLIFILGAALLSYVWLFIRKEHFPLDTSLNMLALSSMYANCGLIMSVYLLVIINYLSNALYEDRRSKQILFWRSLPVSETQNVLGKILVVVAVIPCFLLCINFIAAILFSAMGFLFLQSIGGESYISFPALMDGNVFIVPFQIWMDNLLGIPFILPFIGYFLLVSAWAKRFPLMIALGVPALLMFVDFLLGVSLGLSLGINSWVAQYVDFFADISPTMMLREVFEFQSKFIMPMIISALVGCLFIASSIWLRNHRYEI